MKAITTATEVNKVLVKLFSRCISCQFAVAWAATGFRAFDVLVANRRKIQRMVVGTHFYQTDPAFIERFMDEQEVARFVLNPDGVFHPKIYLFEMGAGKWECIVGSSNFTRGGLGTNDEVSLLITHLDKGADETLAGLKSAISDFWKKGSTLDAAALEKYRAAYKLKRPIVKQMRGAFGPPETDGNDGGKPPSEIELLQMRWSELLGKFHEERHPSQYGPILERRLRMIGAIKALFQKYATFDGMPIADRQRIAGVGVPGRVEADGIDYGWFGGMSGAGVFKKAIKNNDKNLSLALDAIPLTGNISREMYLEYVERYKRAFPEGRHGIATATRLLAMKRPDTFLCLDGPNKKKVCGWFGIPLKVDYEPYWDSIIERITRDALWWQPAAAPKNDEELEVWHARVAFLDSISYVETRT